MEELWENLARIFVKVLENVNELGDSYEFVESHLVHSG